MCIIDVQQKRKQCFNDQDKISMLIYHNYNTNDIALARPLVEGGIVGIQLQSEWVSYSVIVCNMFIYGSSTLAIYIHSPAAFEA